MHDQLSPAYQGVCSASGEFMIYLNSHLSKDGCVIHLLDQSIFRVSTVTNKVILLVEYLTSVHV